MFDWLKDDPPDAWTPDRRARVRLLDSFNGDGGLATAVWTHQTHADFARWLRKQGRITDWPASADTERVAP